MLFSLDKDVMRNNVLQIEKDLDTIDAMRIL